MLGTTTQVFTHRSFRLVWSASMVIYLASWMGNVAGAWLMTQLTNSAFLVALVQTASALPFLLLSLPAGVLADVMDRRRLMLAVQIGNVIASLLLALLVWQDMLGPWALIGMTFVLGSLLAVNGPAAQAIVAEAVPREQMQHAVALNSMSYNLARSVGPGMAGVLLTLTGASALYAFTGLAYLVSTVALQRLPAAPTRARVLPPERLWAALQAGLRYARHAPAVQAVIVRSSVFTLAGSALWALLPLVAKQGLGGSAAGFGVLIACLGGGAILGGLLLEPLRRRASLDGLVTGASLAFATATLVVALLHEPLAVYATLVLGGAAWMVGNTTLFTLIQTNVPSWVRARANALLLVIFQGGMALGAMAWGAVAGRAGVALALTVAALGALPLQLLNRRFPLRHGSTDEVTLARTWTEGDWSGAMAASDGQVAVETRYTVPAEHHAEFLELARRLGNSRRRDGAIYWRLYSAVDEPDVFLERVLVESWTDYQRHQLRSTVADRELQTRLHSLQKPGEAITSTRFVSVG
jgi:MFS family permease